MNTITLATILFGGVLLVLAENVPHVAYGPPVTGSVLLPVAIPAPAGNKLLPQVQLAGTPAPAGNKLLPQGQLAGTPAPAGNKLLPSQVIIPPGQIVDVRDAYGQYSHGYSGPDGTKVSEQGSLLSTNDGWETVIVKKGSYSYTSPEGQEFTVNYVADDKGYRLV